MYSVSLSVLLSYLTNKRVRLVLSIRQTGTDYRVGQLFSYNS